MGNVRIQDFAENKMIRFSLVTNYMFKGRDGNASIETTWHNVVYWANQKNVPPFEKIEKGALIHVTGRLRNREYENGDGEKRNYWEVLASKAEIVDAPQEQTI